MSGFYVSMIFFGILLILLSLACVFIDKRKVFSFNTKFEDRKQELVDIIDDAEQMIEELNKFSDYIVNQMDLKNEQLCRNLKSAEEKVNVLSERAKAAVNMAEVVDETAVVQQCDEAVRKECIPIVEIAEEAVGMAVNSGVYETAPVQKIAGPAVESVNSSNARPGLVVDGVNCSPMRPGLVVDGVNCSPMRPGLVVDGVNCSPMRPVRKSEKVIQINNKYSEVIRLSQEGFSGLEIAKRLNLGKGEVELILGLRK